MQKKKHVITLLFICFQLTVWAQVSKTVNVSVAGNLSTSFNSTEQISVTNLTVSGYLDARDFAFMRDKLKVLSVLNLSSARISLYVGINGTYSGISLVYPANELPMYAFYNANTNTFKSGLTAVTLPSTITSIGYLAFYYCWNLNGTFTIPASVKSIGDYALYGCNSIDTYVVESANSRYSSYNGILLSKAQDSIFICPKSKSGPVTLPSTVTWIGPSAFDGCSNITGTLTFPSSLKKINDYAFYYCTGLTGDLTFPTSLNTLGNYAFYNCSNLNGIVSLQKNLTSIGTNAFLECNKISAFSVNSMNTAFVASNGILYSKNMDTLLIYPSGKTGNYTIPSTIKVLKDYCFYKCTGINGNMNISSAIDSIGKYAFFGCSKITSYSADESNKKYTSMNGILYSKDLKRLIVCPASTAGIFTIPETIQRIEASAFCGCNAISGYLLIPDEVKYIGDYAFYGCDNLSGYTVGSNNIRYGAKDGLLYSKNLDSLFIAPLNVSGNFEVPGTVKYIGYSAFDSCTQLTEVIFSSSVKIIDNYAFENCSGLNHIWLPENIVSIGSAAFFNCSSLQKIDILQTIPPVIDYYTLAGINKSTCILNVPTGTSASYKNANYWNEFNILNESTFTSNTFPKLQKQKLAVSKSGKNVIIDGVSAGENITVYNINGAIVWNGSSVGNKFIYSKNSQSILFFKVGRELIKIQ